MVQVRRTYSYATGIRGQNRLNSSRVTQETPTSSVHPLRFRATTRSSGRLVTTTAELPRVRRTYSHASQIPRGPNKRSSQVIDNKATSSAHPSRFRAITRSSRRFLTTMLVLTRVRRIYSYAILNSTRGPNNKRSSRLTQQTATRSARPSRFPATTRSSGRLVTTILLLIRDPRTYSNVTERRGLNRLNSSRVTQDKPTISAIP